MGFFDKIKAVLCTADTARVSEHDQQHPNEVAPREETVAAAPAAEPAPSSTARPISRVASTRASRPVSRVASLAGVQRAASGVGAPMMIPGVIEVQEEGADSDSDDARELIAAEPATNAVPTEEKRRAQELLLARNLIRHAKASDAKKNSSRALRSNSRGRANKTAAAPPRQPRRSSSTASLRHAYQRE